jgi:hypothetical protein
MPRIAYMQRPAVRPAALVRGRLNAFIHRCVHEARRKLRPLVSISHTGGKAGTKTRANFGWRRVASCSYQR